MRTPFENTPLISDSFDLHFPLNPMALSSINVPNSSQEISMDSTDGETDLSDIINTKVAIS